MVNNLSIFQSVYKEIIVRRFYFLKNYRIIVSRDLWRFLFLLFIFHLETGQYHLINYFRHCIICKIHLYRSCISVKKATRSDFHS